jgi:O-antigen biosynthesis protein
MSMRLKQFFPEGSVRLKFAKKIKKLLRGSHLQGYSAWAHEQRDKIQLFEYEKLNYEPLISIVVPAYNTPERYLEPLVNSVIGQLYENWELVLVDASNDPLLSKNIENQQNIDKRIKVFPIENKGISENTNYGIKKAKGEYIALLDHDDLISYDAVYEVVRAINNNPDSDLIYSDEDKITDDGGLFVQPHLKPDWSPDLLTHVNYITHFLVIRKIIIEKVGYLDPDKDGSQDFDLVLRVTDYTKNIVHIPKILYHWRLAANSTAQDISNKPYIKEAGVRALTNHYKRIKVDAKVTAKKDKPGFYSTDYLYKEKVTIVVDQFAEPLFVSWYITELLKDNKDVRIISTVDGN